MIKVINLDAEGEEPKSYDAAILCCADFHYKGDGIVLLSTSSSWPANTKIHPELPA